MGKAYAHIADAIEAHAATLPAEAKPLPKAEQTPYQAHNGRRLQRVHTVERTKLTVDGITLRFPASKPAALAVAAKYRKGKTAKRTWTPPRMPTMRPAAFSQATLNAFIDDREYDNAEQYAKLHGRRLYWAADKSGERSFPLRDATPLDTDPRFVVGRRPARGSPHHRNGTAWNVTHIASGSAATRNQQSRDDALAEFAKVDRAKLEAAIAPYHDNGADRPAHAENATTGT